MPDTLMLVSPQVDVLQLLSRLSTVCVCADCHLLPDSHLHQQIVVQGFRWRAGVSIVQLSSCTGATVQPFLPAVVSTYSHSTGNWRSNASLPVSFICLTCTSACTCTCSVPGHCAWQSTRWSLGGNLSKNQSFYLIRKKVEKITLIVSMQLLSSWPAHNNLTCWNLSILRHQALNIDAPQHGSGRFCQFSCALTLG